MSKITESARDQECTMRIPGICNFDRATTVWAHANGNSAGKGFGLKSPDSLGCYACSSCHDLYDRRVPKPKGMRREDIELAFHHGHQRSYQILLEKGLVEEK
jgi:Protein of unknown function (DUF1364)